MVYKDRDYHDLKNFYNGDKEADKLDQESFLIVDLQISLLPLCKRNLFHSFINILREHFIVARKI